MTAQAIQSVVAECASIPRLPSHVVASTIASYSCVSHVSKSSVVVSYSGMVFGCVQSSREVALWLELITRVLSVERILSL